MGSIQFSTPVGNLTVCERDGAIILVLFGDQQRAPLGASPLPGRAKEELSAYFAGERRSFDLPLAPAGTAFQQRVWRALCEIPYGQAVTYGELAARIGSPKAVRAVGQAARRNPIPILIPCHRVIGANGRLTGYAGGLAIKEALLRLEGAIR